VVTIVQHYRDRADCENNFDEIKNQWLVRVRHPEARTLPFNCQNDCAGL